MPTEIPQDPIDYLHQLDEAVYAVERPLSSFLRIRRHIRRNSGATLSENDSETRALAAPMLQSIDKQRRSSLLFDWERALMDAAIIGDPPDGCASTLDQRRALPLGWDETISDAVTGALDLLKAFTDHSREIADDFRAQATSPDVTACRRIAWRSRMRSYSRLVTACRLLRLGIDERAADLSYPRPNPAHPVSLLVCRDSPWVAMNLEADKMSEWTWAFIKELADRPDPYKVRSAKTFKAINATKAFQRLKQTDAAIFQLLLKTDGPGGGYSFNPLVQPIKLLPHDDFFARVFTHRS